MKTLDCIGGSGCKVSVESDVAPKLVQIGTRIEVDIPQTLRDIINERPELKKLTEGGIIQKVIVIAAYKGATRIIVNYIPKKVE